MSEVHFNAVVIDQMKVFLDQISRKQYSEKIEVLSGASIGQHVRHILDFYLCILNRGDGIISYDRRRRDTQTENKPEYALEVCGMIREQIPVFDTGEPVTIISEFNGSVQQNASSIGRELIYALDHTVHHLALIRIGLRIVAPHIEISENLGVAPSTIQYRQQQCAQ